MNIRDALRKRKDFCPYLIHLTRGRGTDPVEQDRNARRSLRSILSEKVLLARKPHGFYHRCDEIRDKAPPRSFDSVCLTETPVRYLGSIIGDLSGRQDRLDNYGLVFSKRFIMKAGGNPVWYVCTKRSNRLATAIRALLTSSEDAAECAIPVLSLFETFGPGYFNRDKLVDFNWEREWRVPRNVAFRRKDILLGLCPKKHIDKFEARYKPIKFIDVLDKGSWEGKVEKAEERAWGAYLRPFPKW